MDFEIVGDVAEIQNLFAEDVGEATCSEGRHVEGGRIHQDLKSGEAKGDANDGGGVGGGRLLSGAGNMGAGFSESEDTWPCSNCGRYQCDASQQVPCLHAHVMRVCDRELPPREPAPRLQPPKPSCACNMSAVSA